MAVGSAPRNGALRLQVYPGSAQERLALPWDSERLSPEASGLAWLCPRTAGSAWEQ